MPKLNNKYVLVVDDDAAYLSALKLSMRTCGFNRVVGATDGINALDRLQDLSFDLIISDWNMSPMDGLELLREVREDPATAKIPFILMTADLSETAWREAIKLDATEFLIKPFPLASLRIACHLCLGMSGIAETNLQSLRERVERERGRPPARGSQPVSRLTDESGRFKQAEDELGVEHETLASHAASLPKGVCAEWLDKLMRLIVRAGRQ